MDSTVFWMFKLLHSHTVLHWSQKFLYNVLFVWSKLKCWISIFDAIFCCPVHEISLHPKYNFKNCSQPFNQKISTEGSKLIIATGALGKKNRFFSCENLMSFCCGWEDLKSSSVADCINFTLVICGQLLEIIIIKLLKGLWMWHINRHKRKSN